MSSRGAVLFLGLSSLLFFMSVGAVCPSALWAGVSAAKHVPMMHTLPSQDTRTHNQAPMAMHPLNAPVRPGSKAGGAHLVQHEKRVLIHGAQLPHAMVSPE